MLSDSDFGESDSVEMRHMASDQSSLGMNGHPFCKRSRLCQCTRRCGPRAFFEVLFTKMYYRTLNKALVLCDFVLEGEGVSRPYNGLL